MERQQLLPKSNQTNQDEIEELQTDNEDNYHEVYIPIDPNEKEYDINDDEMNELDDINDRIDINDDLINDITQLNDDLLNPSEFQQDILSDIINDQTVINDYVGEERFDGIDDEILEKDEWGDDTSMYSDTEDDIPLDQRMHGKLNESVLIAFGEKYPNGEIVTINEMRLMKDQIESQNKKIEKIQLWLDISSPNDEISETLGELFDLSALTIDDWFSDDTREKVAFFDDYFTISVNEMRYKDETNILDTYLLHIVVKKNVIITVHSQPIFAVNEIRSRIRTRYGGTCPSSHWVLYAILELVVANYSLLYDQIYEDMTSTEQLSIVLIHDDQDEYLRRIEDMKNRAKLLKFYVSPKKSFLNYILKTQSRMATQNLKIYLRDILDDTLRLLERLSSLIHTLEDNQNTYLSKITLNMNRYGQLENRLMKRFGVFITMFLPMTFMGGLFGMNVLVPGQGEDKYFWFISIVTLCVAGLVTGLIMFGKAK